MHDIFYYTLSIQLNLFVCQFVSVSLWCTIYSSSKWSTENVTTLMIRHKTILSLCLNRLFELWGETTALPCHLQGKQLSAEKCWTQTGVTGEGKNFYNQLFKITHHVCPPCHQDNLIQLQSLPNLKNHLLNPHDHTVRIFLYHNHTGDRRVKLQCWMF